MKFYSLVGVMLVVVVLLVGRLLVSGDDGGCTGGDEHGDGDCSMVIVTNKLG